MITPLITSCLKELDISLNESIKVMKDYLELAMPAPSANKTEKTKKTKSKKLKFQTENSSLRTSLF